MDVKFIFPLISRLVSVTTFADLAARCSLLASRSCTCATAARPPVPLVNQRLASALPGEGHALGQDIGAGRHFALAGAAQTRRISSSSSSSSSSSASSSTASPICADPPGPLSGALVRALNDPLALPRGASPRPFARSLAAKIYDPSAHYSKPNEFAPNPQRKPARSASSLI